MLSTFHMCITLSIWTAKKLTKSSTMIRNEIIDCLPIYTGKPTDRKFEKMVSKITQWNQKRFGVFIYKNVLGAPGTELSNREYGSKPAKSTLVSTFSSTSSSWEFWITFQDVPYNYMYLGNFPFGLIKIVLPFTSQRKWQEFFLLYFLVKW